MPMPNWFVTGSILWCPALEKEETWFSTGKRCWDGWRGLGESAVKEQVWGCPEIGGGKLWVIISHAYGEWFLLHTPFLECSLYVHLAKLKVDRRFEAGEGVLFSPCPYSAIHSELKCTNILILKSLILLHCSVAYYTGGKGGKLESAFNVREKRKFGNQSTP